MSKPRKTKRERLAIRATYEAFSEYKRELIDRNSREIGDTTKPKPLQLPARETKLLSGKRGDIWAKSPRFRDPWNSPRPSKPGTFKGQQMLLGGGKNLRPGEKVGLAAARSTFKQKRKKHQEERLGYDKWHDPLAGINPEILDRVKPNGR